VQTQDIEYTTDALGMVGYLAVPDGSGPRPGVLVCHEGPGLDDHAKRRARMLAELGYVAFALDYNGGGKPLALADVMPRLGALMGDPLRIRAIGQAGLDILLAQERTDRSRLAAIGYCFGGTMALELARGGAPLGAVVGFHSGLATTRPEDAGNIKGKVLVCIGAKDPIIPPDQRTAFEQEMQGGGVDWQMDLYGESAHSFTNPNASSMGMPGIEYHEPSDRRSWKAMLGLFEETIGLP
jgi:dienelactone hydrolase